MHFNKKSVEPWVNKKTSQKDLADLMLYMLVMYYQSDFFKIEA